MSTRDHPWLGGRRVLRNVPWRRRDSHLAGQPGAPARSSGLESTGNDQAPTRGTTGEEGSCEFSFWAKGPAGRIVASGMVVSGVGAVTAPAGGTGDVGDRSGHRNNWSLWLLLIPFIATLVPNWYNSVTPTIGGLPFFDWYLLVWVVIASALVALVYFLRREVPGEGSR